MNKLDEKLDELRQIDNVNILMVEVVDFLQKLQKDFNRAILSKDADILLLQNAILEKDETIKKIKYSHALAKQKLEYEGVIKYLEGKLDDY